MDTIIDADAMAGLERSCAPSPHDWIRLAPPAPGLERMEAFFEGHAYDPHRHDTYAIGYTLNGVQSFDYRGAKMDSTAGKVIVIHPDEVHNGHSGVETGFRYRMLYIEPFMIRDALGERAGSLPFVRDVVADDPRLLAALQPAFDALDNGLEGLEIDQIVVAIADALLARDPSAGKHSRSAISSTAVERARHFLNENFDRVVASEQLEEVTGLDRYALARHFRQQLGTSPYRYLTMRRLDHARRSMRQGAALADAAFSSGFADQSHMTRQFKQAYGMTPGRWRSINAER
ncbi:AraC family transcriptional regulator [Phyllobacterium phragmitis]|uniref:AraC family transcriptional regulator n=1 Tax=Phyllobacterium phragmitis TaxID=2670329 RepID=A0A2S9IXF2_9HYPH|nr:AraC family transcriptional regulator [Phyllobacterium phragmitis]PRD45202.1 AraC family transcriptional regulator [Phyllobacterium phragmitis]